MFSFLLGLKPITYVIAGVMFIIALVIFSNFGAITSMFGYESRDTILQKLKQRNEQLTLLAKANEELILKIDQVKSEERYTCNVALDVKQQEIKVSQEQAGAVEKLEDQRKVILEQAAERINSMDEHQVEAIKEIHTDKDKKVKSVNKKSIANEQLTQGELDALSSINIDTINSFYSSNFGGAA